MNPCGINTLRDRNISVVIRKLTLPAGSTFCRQEATSLFVRRDVQDCAASRGAAEARGRMCYTESAYHRYRRICSIYC
jgi:hypothetical protein